MKLTGNETVEEQIAKVGLRVGRARHFIVGQRLIEAIAVACEFNRGGVLASLDLLEKELEMTLRPAAQLKPTCTYWKPSLRME